MNEEEQNSKPKKVQKGEALWLMSFSDMSLVLLTFFVLLISMMSPNKNKFEQKRLKEEKSDFFFTAGVGSLKRCNRGPSIGM